MLSPTDFPNVVSQLRDPTLGPNMSNVGSQVGSQGWVLRSGSNYGCHGKVPRLGLKECPSMISFKVLIVALLFVAASET